MRPFACIAILAILTNCDSQHVREKPAANDIVGTWECTEFPSGFLRQTGDSSPRKSRIVIRADGTCSAYDFPEREPYRFITIENSFWTLTDPSMTPSGSWNLEFDGNFLQCRQSGSQLELRYHIDVLDGYSVNYRRAK